MNLATLTATLRDVIAIPVTPYRGSDIAIDTFQSLLRRLIDNGIRVVAPNGNTSEFYALSNEERHSLIRASAESVKADAEILVGVGLDMKTAMSDVELAQDQGVRMVMIHQPVHPHISTEGWLDYHVGIATAFPEVGFVLYVRNSYVTGELLRRLGERCENVIGIKYSLQDPVAFAESREAAGAERYAWIAGLAEQSALSYAAHGADGFTSGLANVHPKLSLKLRDLLRTNNFAAARLLLGRIASFEKMRALENSADNVSVVKEALFQLGLCGRTVRPPSHTLIGKKREQVGQILQHWREASDVTLD